MKFIMNHLIVKKIKKILHNVEKLHSLLVNLYTLFSHKQYRKTFIVIIQYRNISCQLHILTRLFKISAMVPPWNLEIKPSNYY